MADVETEKGGMYFVYGYGGTGKTFLWKIISAAIRSKGEIVLNVASSGIASLLLPGGRTAHSRFAIPIAVNEDSTCNIKQGSPLAELIIKCKLIIWDEALMMHKHCFEALDRTMRDLMRFKNSRSSTMTFGEKTVVLGGDFRKILPVIPKCTRQDIVQASINSSYLWNNCEVLRLTKNLRLRGLTNEKDVQKLDSFAKWIADLGDGNLGEDNGVDCNIMIPSLIVLENEVDPIRQIVESTFPEYRSGNMEERQLENRAILAPTLDVVDEVNEYMNGINQAASMTYLSCDSVCKAESNFDMQSQVHTTEFLNSLRCSGVPNHSLTLKVGTPVMLLRNIDHSMGLCNGTRLIVTQLGNHVIEGKIIAGNNAVSRVSNPDGLKLELYNIELTRKLSAGFGNLTNLECLDASTNYLYGDLTKIRHLTQLPSPFGFEKFRSKPQAYYTNKSIGNGVAYYGARSEEVDDSKPPSVNHVYISPALYITPVLASILEISFAPLSSSPYVVNQKRRGGECHMNGKIDGFQVKMSRRMRR
ncbi:PREDICTED: uncharacterized protein LOC109173844 [Ipomoea nil]|uniref:uncharacterized protein LOC109173844 n=1 Tax=Ipomoea nil TaxID=35883 RepID=UPI00090177CE|nr:PREDICTED: uncharacterized protein LOC109173844 [Ipomoea nil]